MPYSRWDSVLTAPESGTVIAVAVFTAEAGRVFRVLTDGDEIQQWWGGGRGGSSVTWEGRPEVGAHWQARGEFSAGRHFEAWGEFLEIEPAQRFVLNWRTSWDGAHPTEVSARFKQINDGTVLTVVHHGFINRRESCQTQARMWWKMIKWLRPYLQGNVYRLPAPEELRQAGAQASN